MSHHTQEGHNQEKLNARARHPMMRGLILLAVAVLAASLAIVNQPPVQPLVHDGAKSAVGASLVTLAVCCWKQKRPSLREASSELLKHVGGALAATVLLWITTGHV